ncbi:acyl-CoA dehydrogenase [Sphingobium sp. BS19]|nr:acyl-CoA dehydrogenase [Sphingobium sp. BS19]
MKVAQRWYGPSKTHPGHIVTKSATDRPSLPQDNRLTMTQFDLTDDQREIQELARRFTADAITPFAAEWDEKHIFPRDTIEAAAELGFGAIYVSEESGGIGLGRLESALIMEAMAYGCPSTSAFISIHNMAAWMIDRFGAQAVKDKYLPAMVSMDTLGSYCLTEAGSGSDAAALKTKAVRDGDHYVVTGSKQFISGGGQNEIYVVMVRTGEDGPKGISCLVIEKDMEGVSFGANERKLGWHSQPTAQVNFDAVRVPVENRVGGEGEGFRIAMMGLDGGRLNIGACSLGGGQRCLDEAIAYTKDRKQFGQAIADFQNTQFTLADMETELQAARTLLYAAAVKVTENAPDKTRFAAMAKRLATDTGSSVVDRALQLHGGYGYLQDYPIERFWRDLRVHSILEGTNQVMRMIIGRELVRQ